MYPSLAMVLPNVTEISCGSPQLWALIYVLKLPACGILKHNYLFLVTRTTPPEIVTGVAETEELSMGPLPQPCHWQHVSACPSSLVV